MLKSTYKPSTNLARPLPPGWTDHKAPTGHTYYYNENTKESTYTRPDSQASAGPQPPPPLQPNNPHASYFQYSSIPQLSDPATANAFLAQYDPARQRQPPQGHHGGRGGRNDGRDNRPRPQLVDKPRSKVAIPGCEPWILVYTKYGRRFAYNPIKNASYWRIPEKVMQGVLELDIKGIKEKAGGDEEEAADDDDMNDATNDADTMDQGPEAVAEDVEEQVEYGSDYEEVEVTDDEREEGEGDENAGNEAGDEDRPSKRQRTEEPDLPVEFNEDDIAFQLQAMGADYGLDQGEYDDGTDPSTWAEGAEGAIPFSDTDARELFKDMLTDHKINPFSPWDKLIEEGRIIDDARYTVLSTMKARKEVWEEWSREGIKRVKEERAKQAKRDPKIPYMAFLAEKATPKLYWPEFKRKYKRETPMRDSSLADRDREKWYREHINRLKLPQETLKRDLKALLQSIPLRALHNQTLLESLPSQLLADIRYISLKPEVRNPIIEDYIATLAPPENAPGEEDEAAKKARDRREKALAERERVVAEEKRMQKRALEYGKAALREEERELERAMVIDKKGIQGQMEAAAAALKGTGKDEEKRVGEEA
ncbi:hypothetical protein F5Y16DRAFT_400065 [Xylariaceae sp. FL0255]|nr:hypothetical protein F5Y16DRAFT_400065 [Xylariaceae sp. FL0255]